MIKIVVVNPKGGSGKSTLATNLASWCAHSGYRTALMDFDAQGSSTRWAGKRDARRAPIQAIAAYERPEGVTRTFQLRLLPGTERLIVDTPAALDVRLLTEVTRDADGILLPVLPSDIDIHAASHCIGDLLVAARINARTDRIAVVANRVRQNTRIYQALMRFLASLQIPLVGILRDAQIYVHAAAAGLGIFELPPRLARRDIEQWQSLLEWTNSRSEHPHEQLRTVG
ncbi:MAG: AAA family ATPase [Gammaproteobacteria bacterium]|nr:AAA family ATPase [Gammaproteobacteria bacterium]